MTKMWKNHDWELMMSHGEMTTDMKKASYLRIWLDRGIHWYIDIELFVRSENKVQIRGNDCVSIHPEASNSLSVSLERLPKKRKP